MRRVNIWAGLNSRGKRNGEQEIENLKAKQRGDFLNPMV